MTARPRVRGADAGRAQRRVQSPVDAGSFRAAAPAILALACLAAYWNSFRAGLLLDSQTLILKVPRLTAATWQNVRDIFAHQYWWPSLESHLHRPVTTLSYWVS